MEHPGRPGSPSIGSGARAGLVWLAAVLVLVGTGSFAHGTVPVGSRPAAAPAEAPAPSPTNATPLAITAFTASLSTFWVGQQTYLNVSAVGGTPPYSYQYTGLPIGCVSHNVSSLRCGPSGAQHYVVRVTVNDTQGNSTAASVSLTVTTGYGGPPVINYFYSMPATVDVGGEVVIYANATSVSSTPSSGLKFQFSNLPPGCASFNQTALQCIPSAPGSFHLWLVATDGFGAFSTARTWLNVTGGGATNSTSHLAQPGAPWFVAGLVAFLGIVAAILLIPRRRRTRPVAPPEPWKP